MQYVKVNNDVAMISVPGFYIFSKCKAVEADVNTACQNGCTKVVVDFSGTQFIDSAAIRQLCGIRARVHPENFSARNASGKTLAALNSENLDMWLNA